jgi:hypothetical protein
VRPEENCGSKLDSAIEKVTRSVFTESAATAGRASAASTPSAATVRQASDSRRRRRWMIRSVVSLRPRIA